MDDLSKPNLLPYGIVPQAPAIQVPDVALFKRTTATAVVHHFQTRVEEIRRVYQKFMEDVQINDLIYSARYNFVPIVGKDYHLYQTDDGALLSLIDPERWSKYPYLGTFRLKSDGVWERSS